MIKAARNRPIARSSRPTIQPSCPARSARRAGSASPMRSCRSKPAESVDRAAFNPNIILVPIESDRPRRGGYRERKGGENQDENNGAGEGNQKKQTGENGQKNTQEQDAKRDGGGNGSKAESRKGSGDQGGHGSGAGGSTDRQSVHQF